MKKFLILLLIAPMLFAACGDNEDDKPYFNPVEGEWVYSLPEYNHTETRVFTKEFEASSISNNNGVIKENKYGKYAIDKTQIIYNDGDIHNYTIIKDTLELITPKTGYTKLFIRKFK